MSKKYIINTQKYIKPIIFDSLNKYIINLVSSQFLNKIINKLIILRDKKINKIIFKNLNKKEQWVVYQICGRLGLFYSSFNNFWPDIYSPIIKKSYNPSKEILIHLTHTPKCGGMSIKHNLNNLNIINIKNYFPKHFTIKSSKGFIIKIVNGHVPVRNFNNSVIRVGFSRDPVKRFNSIFSYITSGAKDREHTKNEFKKLIHKLKKFKNCNELLKDEKIMKDLISYKNGIIHFLSLSYWIGDDCGNCLIDYCLRQEHLQEDWQTLCNILGIKNELILLKKNISKKKRKLKINKNLLYEYYPYDYNLNNFVNKNHKFMIKNTKYKLSKLLKNIKN